MEKWRGYAVGIQPQSHLDQSLQCIFLRLPTLTVPIVKVPIHYPIAVRCRGDERRFGRQ